MVEGAPINVWTSQYDSCLCGTADNPAGLWHLWDWVVHFWYWRHLTNQININKNLQSQNQLLCAGAVAH